MKDELIRVAKNERASAKIKNDTIPTLAGLAVKKIAETLITPELGPETAQIVSTGLVKQLHNYYMEWVTPVVLTVDTIFTEKVLVYLLRLCLKV